MVDLTWDSTDLDNAASESGVVHESTANTDHDNASVLKQGYPYGSFSLITPNPDSVYPFHEDSGSTANDLAGTNDGTINGATVGVTGLLGTTAYSFDGTDDNVRMGDVLKYPSSDFTVTAWVKPSTLDTNNRYIVSTGTNTGYYFRTSPPSNGANQTNNQQFLFKVDDGTNDQFFATAISGGISTGTWYFIAMTADRDNNFVGYVDASQEGSGDMSSVGSGIDNDSNDFVVGHVDENGSPSGADHFDGDIAEVRAYGSVLTQTQLQTLYDVVNTNGSLITAGQTV